MPAAMDRYYTSEDVLAFPDDGNRYELVHGELLVSPSPRWVHQTVVGNIYSALRAFVREHGLGEALLSPADISFGGLDDILVQPDVFVVGEEYRGEQEWEAIRTLSLVAEVLNPSRARFDRFTKCRLYQEMQAPVYWIIDPANRFPSMANGIVGLKPTYGRVSRYGVLPLAESLDHVGPMTRSVADAAIVLEAIAGFDPNDPTSLRAPVPNMRDELGRGVAGLRIGFDPGYALDGVDPCLARATERALDDLRHLGAVVVEVQLPDMSQVLPTWPLLCAAEAADAHRATFPARASEYGAYFREFLAMGAAADEATLARARAIRQECGEQFRAVLSTVDAVLSPAAGAPFEVPPTLQYESMTAWNDERARRQQRLGISKADTTFTFPHDLAGTPALALPCGVTPAGIPYTMQLAGSPLREATLCRIGQAYEEATRWHTLHPPV